MIQESTLLEFVNDWGCEFRVVHEGSVLVLLHRAPARFRAAARGDRWDRGVTVNLSPGMALNPMIGAQVIQNYMLKVLNYNQFEEYRKLLEG